MLFPSGFLWLIYLRSSQRDKIPSMGSLSKCPQQLEPATSQAACYQKLESGTEMQLKFSHSRMGYGYPE